MNIIKENIDNLNAVVKLTIEKSDYETTVDKTLKEYRKKANIPGFRQGKVPMGMVKKMYAKSVIADEVYKLLSRELNEYIQKENLEILGEPLPSTKEQKEIDWDKDETFEFAFDIALAPEVNITLDKRNKLPYYNIQITDDMLDEYITNMTNRYGTNEDAETIEEKDSLEGNFVQVDAEGNAVEEGISKEGALVAVDLIKDEEIKKAFVGKAVNAEVIMNPVEAMGNDNEVAHMLGIKVEDIDTAKTTFKYTVTAIKRFAAHEINEDLFKKIYGEETEIKTEEDFRAEITKEMKAEVIAAGDYRLGVDAKEILINKTNLQLPEVFLKRWLKETNKEITEEQIENDWAGYEEHLQWMLIKSKVAKEFDVKLEENDLREAAKEMAKMQFKQYGFMNIDEEHLDQYADSILQNENEKHRLAEHKMEQKIVTAIKERVNLEEKEVSRQEFDQLFEK